jgi:nitrogen regulatory protein PII
MNETSSEKKSPNPSYLQLITCVVQRGKADKVAKAALDAGAGGATVYFARGMGIRERLGLLGLAVVPEKEVIMIVCKEHETEKIMNAIVKAGNLETPGMGIAYVMRVYDVVGLVPSTGVKVESTLKKK